MFVFTKRSGQPGRARFFPGCLVWSLILSIALTVIVNLLIRAL